MMMVMLIKQHLKYNLWKKAISTEAELKKSVAYKKSLYIILLNFVSLVHLLSLSTLSC